MPIDVVIVVIAIVIAFGLLGPLCRGPRWNRPTLATCLGLTGATPGGEFKSARAHANSRRGFFGRSFGAPYYNGPQAYYGSPWSLSRW
jgi:hypothetical protein